MVDRGSIREDGSISDLLQLGTRGLSYLGGADIYTYIIGLPTGSINMGFIKNSSNIIIIDYSLPFHLGISDLIMLFLEENVVFKNSSALIS